MKHNSVNFNNHSTMSGDDKSISVKSGLWAGFIASLVSAIILVVLTAVIVIPDFNFVLLESSIFGLADSITAAWIVYFVVGTLVWGLLYGVFESYFPKKEPSSKGLVFGFIIWLVFMVGLMPLAEAGLFLQRFGYVAALIVLITDLVFGVTLGLVYDKTRRS